MPYFTWWLQSLKGFPGGSGVKNLPANARKAVQSLGWEGHLKKETAAHPSILSWKIQLTEEPGGLQSIESQRIGHDLEAQQQQLQQSLKQWEIVVILLSYSSDNYLDFTE